MQKVQKDTKMQFSQVVGIESHDFLVGARRSLRYPMLKSSKCPCWPAVE